MMQLARVSFGGKKSVSFSFSDAPRARHTRRRRVAHRAARSSLKRDKSFSMGQKMKQMRFERDASVALARGDGGSLETCVRGWRDAMVP